MKEANLNTKETLHHGELLFPVKMYYSVLGQAIKDLYLHWHDDFEIIHIKEGTGLFYIDLKPVDVREETFILINPATLHSGAPYTTLDCETLVFDLNSLRSTQSEIQDLEYITPLINHKAQVIPCITKSHPAFKTIKTTFSSIESALRKKENAYELLVRASLYILIHTFYSMDLVTSNEDYRHKDNKKQRLSNILTYIDNHYQEDITVTDIASHIGVSDHYFCHFYKEMTGTTFKHYLNRYRIQRACDLLLNSDKEIIEVAELSGFYNLSYFYRQFKKFKGMTPAKFKSSTGYQTIYPTN